MSESKSCFIGLESVKWHSATAATFLSESSLSYQFATSIVGWILGVLASTGGGESLTSELSEVLNKFGFGGCFDGG